MDLQPFLRVIFFDLNNCFVDSPCCRDDDIAVLDSHLRCCVLVPDCRYCALGIPSWVHDPDVGRSLLVEMHSIEY